MKLQAYPGSNSASATGINSQGYAVGGGDRDGFSIGTLWDSDGNIYDLNDLIDTDLDVTIDVAYEINENGQILSYGYELIEGEVYIKAFLLDPVIVPEPFISGIFLMAGLAMRRRR